LTSGNLTLKIAHSTTEKRGFMENFIDTISGNIYLMIGAFVILGLLILSFVKKLFKMALVVVVALVAYVLYLNFTGQDVERTLKKNMKAVEDRASDVTKKAGELMDNDAIKQAVDKAAKTISKK